jgi:hypothetical protein
MNYKIIITFFLLLSWFSIHAQNDKLRLAVFDPTFSGTGIDEGTRMAVREIISSTFVNSGKYTIVERSLIERVMQEQQFSNSGAVNDSHASEIGKLIGANKIVLSVLSLAGRRNMMLSIKLVDVQTANVERQKTQVFSTNQLLNIVEPLALQLIGEEVNAERQTQIASATANNTTRASQAVSRTSQQTTSQTKTEKLTSQGGYAFINGRSTNSKIVWGVRAGANRISSNHGNNTTIEAGPTIYHSFNNIFYLHSAIMLGSTSFGYYNNKKIYFIIPFYVGYHLPCYNNTSLFIQAGPFFENWDSSQGVGLATMTGINIQRFMIEIGYRTTIRENYYLLKHNSFFLGIGYVL